MITRNLLTRSYKLLLTLLVLLMSTNAFAQRLTATGKVTDAAGLEVIGASVLEKGTANGVVTNLDGEFSLSVGQNATLVISFIGYKTIEVKATTNMNITLQEDNELLDEVAHGNSLRGIIKYLKHIPDEEIVGLNLPTAIPYVFEFDDDLNLKKDYFLGDPEEIKKLMEAVADQGKTTPDGRK